MPSGAREGIEDEEEETGWFFVLVFCFFRLQSSLFPSFSPFVHRARDLSLSLCSLTSFPLSLSSPLYCNPSLTLFSSIW